MKTDKEVSREVTEKITKLEALRLRARKRAKQIMVAVIMVGFLIPATVHFVTTEELNHPLQYAPPASETPFDPDVIPEDSTETFYYDDGVEQIEV